jgi:glucan phosphoethanolaminetransferase (alkaline phosphatase superfamily)
MARVYLNRDGQVRGYSLGLGAFIIFRAIAFLIAVCWPFGFFSPPWVWAVAVPWWALLAAAAAGTYLSRRTAARR